MALCKSTVLKVYTSVIEDVISNVRDIFSDEGLDEQVLQELKMLWETKLMASKAIENAQDTVEVKNEKGKTVVNGAVYNGTTAKQQFVKQQTQTVQQQPQPAQTMPVQCTSTNLNTEDKLIPIQITLPAQPTIDSVSRVLTIHVPTSALNGQLHTLLTGPVITATMGLPTSLASSLLQQHVNAALQNQQVQAQAQAQSQAQANALALAQAQAQAQNHGHVQTTLSQQKPTIVGIDNGNCSIKLDGPFDTSDEDDDGSEDDGSEDEAEDDKEDDDPDVMDDQVNEEEPLNSEDDVTDEEPADMFDTDNVVVCQYDKITRSRNKWKFYLKDGIMNLDGEDFLFQKANGDAEW